MTKKEVLFFNKVNVFIDASPRGYGFSYFAKKDFKPGQEVMRGWGKIIGHQTPHISVQIGTHKHYLPSVWTGRYWNHSCNPNACVKTRPDGFPSLRALKNIRKGDEINYHYSMTEYQWIKDADENHVPCLCGEKNCKKRILAFSQLSKNGQMRLKRERICSKYLLMVE